jgi:membrane associated rhomboid family serine protease
MKIKEIFKNIKLIDWFIFLIFPAIVSVMWLWSFYYFPDYIKNPLFLNIAHPQWWQFITLSFVHFTFNHFFINLVVYFIFGIILLLIFKDCNLKKSDFVRFVLTLVVFLSILTGVISILIYKKGFAGGSSGITSAMFLFLVVVIWGHNYKKMSKQNWKDQLIKLASWVVFTCIGIYCLFPRNTAGVSIFGHLVGIVIGFILAIIFLKKYDIKKWRLE